MPLSGRSAPMPPPAHRHNSNSQLLMTSILAAAVQMNSQPDLERNMEQVRVDVARAAREGARLVTLPENFAYLGSELGKHRQADRIAQAVMEQIPALARKFGVWLLAGGFPVLTEPGNPRSRAYNRAIVADPDGRIIARYDKIHLFDITLSDEEQYRESSLVEPGKIEPVVCDLKMDEVIVRSGRTTAASGNNQIAVESPGSHSESAVDNERIVRLGLSICYDVRFPELYRRLSEQGANVLCVPAAFTRPTGAAHWETLLRTRAIENTCYVIAPAQTGLHGKSRTTHGHSLIIDPWGNILANAQKKPGVIFAEINTGLVKEVREKLPSLHHRRL
jgi:deaminated glutathione amidase